MKKLIFGVAVFAASVFGAYTANQTEDVLSIGLLDATDIEAEAAPNDGGQASTSGYTPIGPISTGPLGEAKVIRTVTYEVEISGEAGAGWEPWISVKGKKKRKATVTESVLSYPCMCSNSNACQPYQETATSMN